MEVNVGAKKRRKWHLCCVVLRYISYAKFSQILEVLRDFHRLFGSRNSPTTSILHIIRHVYRSVWPAKEEKSRFATALGRSAHCWIYFLNEIFPRDRISDLVDLWVTKIKKPMILCARGMSRSREQYRKRRSRSESPPFSEKFTRCAKVCGLFS